MSAEYKDYYRILGVERRATEQEIKTAFRRMARRYHPDVNPDDKTAEDNFKDVNEAYEVLSDADKRRRFDAVGPIQWKRTASTAAAKAKEAQRPGQSPFDIFHSVFSSVNGRRGRARAGRTIEQDVSVSLEEAFSGSTRVFSVQGEKVCATCEGVGRSADGTSCATCAGGGLIPFKKKIEVTIPRGVREGSRIRIAGEGGAGILGGATGDLYFVVHVKPNERFQRDDDNLLLELDIPVTMLVLGGEVEVPTLARSVRMRIPPTTINGRQFRLAGQGMPRLNATGQGDLLVRVNAALPRALTDQQRRLYEELRQLEGAQG